MERVLKYQEIESYMLQELSSGRFSVEDRFFSEADVARQFDVTILTARKAFAQLEKQGYIIRQRGRGTFVRELPPQPSRLKILKRCVIGIVVGDSDFDNDLKLGRIIAALHRTIEKAGYLSLLVGENFSVLAEAGVSGVIVLDRISEQQVRRLTATRLPVVGIYPVNLGFPRITIDFTDAAERIVTRFQQSGARKIAMVGEGEDALVVRNLFEKEMASAAAKHGVKLTIAVPPIGSVRAEFSAMFDTVERPDAVFAMNSWSLDTITSVLREKNLKIGKDISLLVNGSNALLIPSSPGYSIIDLDIPKAAENCMTLLQQMIRDPQAAVTGIVTPYGTIIERGSLCRPPAIGDETI